MHDIFEVIKGVILGIILGFMGYFVAKYFLNFVVLYLKWNMAILKKERKIFYFRIIDFSLVLTGCNNLESKEIVKQIK